MQQQMLDFARTFEIVICARYHFLDRPLRQLFVLFCMCVFCHRSPFPEFARFGNLILTEGGLALPLECILRKFA